MSGHSKWANIKRTKAVVDAKKGVVYAKMAREIIVAAKLGGGDPAANVRLRHAIDRAKTAGVPNDNIQRAIEKGSGTGAADQMEELTYEGYGPGGVAIMVKCATDNRNRTAGDIRSYFSKYGGNLGESGCVGWMFKERGEIMLERPLKISDDDVLMAALDAGADDVETDSDEYILVVCKPAELDLVQESLKKAGLPTDTADVNMCPLSTAEISDRDVAKQLLKLMDIIENHDDVQKVFANFEMDQGWIQEFMNN